VRCLGNRREKLTMGDSGGVASSSCSSPSGIIARHREQRCRLSLAVRIPGTRSRSWGGADYNCSTELKRDDVARLADVCEAVGIEFMASVFDIERIAWLEAVGVRRYKLASRSINDTDLIRAVAATGTPILASLGWWKQPEFPAIQASRVQALTHPDRRTVRSRGRRRRR
jgi:hypothetical protein